MLTEREPRTPFEERMAGRLSPGSGDSSPGREEISRPTAIGFVRSLDYSFQLMEQMELSTLLRGALGEHLAERFLWTHWTTLTLRDRYEGSRRIPLGQISLARAWREWVRFVRRTGRARLEWFAVTEFQKRGVPHIHALLIAPGIYGFERGIVDWFYDAWGINELERYNPTLGAGAYLGKYLAKDSRIRVETSRGLDQYRSPAVNGVRPALEPEIRSASVAPAV